MQLNGADLGVTRVGAPFDEAVAAVTAVLGPPAEDPASGVTCIAAVRDVSWPELRLAEDEGGVLGGWSTSSGDLAAPSGVRVGVGVPTLRDVYGDRLRLRPANPDNPPTFAVSGVDFFGSLSSTGDDAAVTSLFTGFCSGP